MPPRTLVVTGSLLTLQEPSPLHALQRQLAAMRASNGAWLDIRIKLQAARSLTAIAAWRKTATYQDAPYRDIAEKILAPASDPEPPELAELILASGLMAEGLEVSVATWAQLDASPEKYLEKIGVVFASTTLLRDLSELIPLIAKIKPFGVKIVVGGSLTSIIRAGWPEGISVVAAGYGEWLLPSLAAWIKSDFQTLPAPERGTVDISSTPIRVSSGVPTSLSLDTIPTPDWALANTLHQTHFRRAGYESVRGCPYRCAFCNYPFLFDDTKFRVRSASVIASDWLKMAAAGIRLITCLDSLFTVPKRRLLELCQRLIAAGSPVSWICYARADDLDASTAALMKNAGCIQVQLGLESGSEAQLKNMNKQCSVEANASALKVCREVGLVSLCTLVVGFPGETRQSLQETVEFLLKNPCDVYYLAPFNTRVAHIPILQPENRQHFKIQTQEGGQSGAPYWKHATMSCSEVVEHMEWMHQEIRKVSLDGLLFYSGLDRYQTSDKPALLQFQQAALKAAPVRQQSIRFLERLAQRRLETAVVSSLGKF